MADIACTLCGLSFPRSEMNRYGECVECVDNADHVLSEGYDPF